MTPPPIYRRYRIAWILLNLVCIAVLGIALTQLYADDMTAIQLRWDAWFSVVREFWHGWLA